MDSQDGWRLQPVAEPVSYYDRMTGQWTSGSFETAVKSEQRAAVVTSSDRTTAAASSSSAFAAAAQDGCVHAGPCPLGRPVHKRPNACCLDGTTALYANAAGGTTRCTPTPPAVQRWLRTVMRRRMAATTVSSCRRHTPTSHQSQPASQQHQWMPSTYESRGVSTRLQCRHTGAFDAACDCACRLLLSRLPLQHKRVD